MIQTLGLALFGGAVGAVTGSFATTAALRGVRGEQYLFGPSRCDACGVGVPLGRSVPVISYAGLAGSARCCGARIDRAHPVGEAVGLLIGAGAFLVGDPVRTPILLVMGMALLAASVVDARTQRLPDVLTAVVAICGLGLAAHRSLEALAVGVIASGVTFVVIELARRALGVAQGRQALGLGDVKLVAALAIWLGPVTPWALAFACLAGLVAFASFRPADGRLAFGPYLAGVGWTFGFALELGLWPTSFS